ncbi:putative f-box domain containing protein [Golovinomyces cichoracearum]|uniref:Putative f-box domain containing protein n=1 Tax=Golovinomyces cichoracearum TaxID=62708 RepID=A0A420ING2_9PEZI|nr:putative f-box domain containing protein [Golovinomyces cichoracearum]
MAENYLLQVTAGPSYDRSGHQVVPVNSPKTTSIESDFIFADLNVRIQSYRGLPLSSPSTSSYFSLPSHAKNNDRYSISFSFSLKSTINGNDLVFGNDFDHPIRDRLPPGFNTAFRIVKWFIDPGLEGDLYADKPYLYGPLLSSINILHIGHKDKKCLTNENIDQKAGLVFVEGGCEDGMAQRKSKGIPCLEASRKKHFLNQENRSRWNWEAGREYGCDFFNPYLDFNGTLIRVVSRNNLLLIYVGFLLRLPGFTLPIMKYWDGQSRRLVSSNYTGMFFMSSLSPIEPPEIQNKKETKNH